MSQLFNPKGKLVALRVFRLGHLPTAWFGAEILIESGVPFLAIEFGYPEEKVFKIERPIPRIRLDSSWSRYLPLRIRPSIIFFVSFLRIMKFFSESGKPRLILAHGLHEQVMALLFWKFLKIPYVVHVHEVFDTDKKNTPFNRLLSLFEGKALREALFLIFPEAGRRKAYQERYGLKNPIYTAFNCPRFRQKTKGKDLRADFGLPQESLLMIYLGGVGEVNALKEVITAMPKFSNLFFFVVGWAHGKYHAELRSLSEELGLKKRVLFLGEVENKWEYLDACDLSYCVYRPTSLRTRHLATASNKLMESLASGLPVITNNGDDFRDIVETYDVGTCIPEITSASLEKTIGKLIQERTHLKKMSRNGLECHRTIFHYEVQFAPVLSAFLNILELERPLPQKVVGSSI